MTPFSLEIREHLTGTTAILVTNMDDAAQPPETPLVRVECHYSNLPQGRQLMARMLALVTRYGDGWTNPANDTNDTMTISTLMRKTG